MLENHPNIAPDHPQRRALRCADILSADQNFAGCRTFQSVGHPQQRRFSGPRSANDPGDRSGFDGEGHIVNGRDSAAAGLGEGLSDGLKNDRRAFWGSL